VVEYARLVGGFRGDLTGVPFGTGWNWDLYVQHSRSDGEYGQDVILDDAVDSADGRSDFGTFGLFNFNSLPRDTASCAGLTTPISNRPCVDVRWMDPDFLAGNFTQAERDFLFDHETGKTIYTQTFVEGFVGGDVLQLPAGPLGAVAGFVMRRDEIEDTPGAVTLADNSWGLTGAGITKGDDTTREVFGELDIPVIEGVRFAENIRLTVSGRYTDVESYGDNTTYKVGLSWQIIPALKVRATKGTSFRAPGLFELYLADQTSFLGQRTVDPCINWGQSENAELRQNCAADGVPADFGGGVSSAEIVSGGGFGLLQAETSEAETFGVVWTPGFADLSIAIDYFDIRIDDEITQLGANNIPFLCYTSDTFPTDPICSLFERNPSTLGIDLVRDDYINIATQTNRGIDLTVRYQRELPFQTELTLDGQATWQLQDTINLFADNDIDSNGSTAWSTCASTAARGRSTGTR
jgi:iron complex outermembrane receptor protein